MAPPHEIAKEVMRHTAEWRLAHEKRRPDPEQVVIQKWDPPEDGWIKLNTDGAVSRHNDKGVAALS